MNLWLLRKGYYRRMDTERALSHVVVLANNDEKVLQTVSRALDKAGFAVLAAQNEAAAVQVCREHAPVHLAIIDLAAARTDAMGMVAQLRDCSPEMRLLVLADEGQPADIERWPVRGQRPMILRKPFRRSQFLGKVLQISEEPLVLTA